MSPKQKEKRTRGSSPEQEHPAPAPSPPETAQTTPASTPPPSRPATPTDKHHRQEARERDQPLPESAIYAREGKHRELIAGEERSAFAEIMTKSVTDLRASGSRASRKEAEERSKIIAELRKMYDARVREADDARAKAEAEAGKARAATATLEEQSTRAAESAHELIQSLQNQLAYAETEARNAAVEHVASEVLRCRHVERCNGMLNEVFDF